MNVRTVQFNNNNLFFGKFFCNFFLWLLTLVTQPHVTYNKNKKIEIVWPKFVTETTVQLTQFLTAINIYPKTKVTSIKFFQQRFGFELWAHKRTHATKGEICAMDISVERRAHGIKLSKLWRLRATHSGTDYTNTHTHAHAHIYMRVCASLLGTNANAK